MIGQLAPLGPMNSKSYATTISPWVVTLDALSPYACKPLHLATTESYLHHLQIPDVSCATFDINLEVFLRRNDVDYKICSSNLKGLLWTPFQQLAHQASSGCGFRTGDLLGTGTISNSETDETGTKIGLGCLFEATKGGYSKYQFKDGTQLGYLEDYDSIVIRARCGGLNGFGFGDCIGTLLPSYP
jgi:fumarylacetoacetase